ncbi:hypothetical protein PtB15_6B174 [Puccinia triticina]|nr:hypothetical protein PtB15_6B174 [Puccinia triticina]
MIYSISEERELYISIPYSNTSSPSTQGPHSPASNSHPHHNHQPLLRGSLAQAKLRGHPIPDHLPLATLSLDHHHHHHNHHHRHNHHNHSHHSHKPALPKPPVHSQHALWVGNIPNDASHEELWKFFSAQRQQQAPLPGAGVESIHLIARSNCAFVNYISQAHLAQAIACSNGKPLRALDPYCKPLLCRIRKPEDNIKSGVGAQRIGGLENNHHHQQHSNSLNESSNIRTSSTLTAASNQSQSTTSSFLTSHFPRRYFILKAYTDEDLRISVDRSIWVSQTHNEPVLDQAYRTSAEGVYLIFSANQSGAFFGYARMAGPISGGTSARRARRKSLPPGSPAPATGSRTSSGAAKQGPGRTRSASIGTTDRTQDARFGDLPNSASPRALSPVLPDSPLPTRWPGSPVRRSLPILGGPKTAATLPAPDRAGNTLMSGKPFKVEWIRVQKLGFYRTKNLRNPFKEVKVSRDGTEVEPTVGAAIVAEIEAPEARTPVQDPRFLA